MARPAVISVDALGSEIRDFAHGEWWGMPRHEIHRGPTIDPDRCIGCGLCYVTCDGRVVYDWEVLTGRPVMGRFDSCSPGCTTCANLCPVDAISFPDIAVIRRERDIHGVVAKARARVTLLSV